MPPHGNNADEQQANPEDDQRQCAVIAPGDPAYNAEKPAKNSDIFRIN